MFLRIIIILLLGGDALFWWRADRAIRTRRLARWILLAFMLLELGGMARILILPFAARHNSNRLDVAVMASVYLWHLLILPFTLVGMAVMGVVVPVMRRLRRVRREEHAAAVQRPEANLPQVSRRQTLAVAAVAIPPLLTGVALGASTFQLKKFRIRAMQLSLKDLPRALDGMTIAHVTDTHIGRFTDDAFLRHIAETANGLEADLMLFAGDLIDFSQLDLPPAISFARQLRGRFGAVFCEGNHDLIEDESHHTRRFESDTRAAGLPMLFDEARTLRVRDYPVQIQGIRWGRNDAQRAALTVAANARMDPDAFPILLAHHPHCFDWTNAPLTLAGHTHGGQLMLTERVGAGPVLFRYWSGLYRRANQALVVSNGVGNWFPLRTHAPAEIIHLTLRCA